MPSPTSFTLNNVKYKLKETGGAYKRSTEPAVVSQPSLAGTSRPNKNPRPDELTWVLDDWSQGESDDFLRWNSEDGHPSQKGYYRSSGAVEVGTPGQAKLGQALTLDLSIVGTATAEGPHLIVTTNPWVFYRISGSSTEAQERVAGVWTARTTGFTGATTLIGPPHALGGFIYAGVGDTGAAGTRVRRISSSTNAQFWDNGGQMPMPADNRLYAINEGSQKLTLLRSPLTGTLPLTPTSVYTADGVVGQGGITSIGKDIYVATQQSGEPARLHKYDGDTGVEFARFPLGFRTAFQGTTTPLPLEALVNQNQVLFLSGFRVGTTGEPEAPTLMYVMSDRYGTVGIIRPDTSNRGTSLLPDHRNGILLGTKAGNIFRYDMNTGGMYEFLESKSEFVTSLAFVDGAYYVATGPESGTGTGKVYKTIPSGSGKYVSTATIQSPIWDFDYDQQVKLITEVEVHTSTLPSGASVEVQLLLDDATTITTDSAGATMAHTTGSRTKFTVSTTGTSRTCRYLRVDILLKTSNTANTPTLYSVTVKALAKSFVHFFDLAAVVESDTAENRLAGEQLTGWAKAANLETLVNTDPQVIVDFIPYFSKGDGYAYPQSSVTTHKVVLEGLSLDLDRKGEGDAAIRLRKV